MPSQAVQRRLPVGAEIVETGVHFRVWAPKRKHVALVYEGGETPLHPEDGGYFSVLLDRAKAGWRYRYRLDGEETLYPDPASRYQPEGPHGPSEVVDPRAFTWTDDGFAGIEAPDVILYELHIGTFTPEGTWRAAIEKLPHLRELGITCIELMPVADWQGRWNWGYDGVDLFAPTRNYGTPDDMRLFVDRAHDLGIAVILDVVYNHLGPDGNYVSQFTDTFFSTKHKTDWGEAINFDDDGSNGVRDFYLANARYWVEEFHLDGYRYDATQNIYDDSKEHILAQISKSARAAAPGKSLYLITENEPQQTWVVRPHEQGGYNMNGLWNDDFHHTAVVALTGRNEAYYTDYLGKPQEMISALKYGYLYQGQYYRWQKRRRGHPGLDLPPHAFVNYIQNHDQIANYGRGHRIDRLAGIDELRAMTVLLLLAPQAPMLFQGQEWMASSDFNYFVDHNETLNGLINEGRLRELSQFPSIADPELLKLVPVPAAPETFTACRLNWDEPSKRWHAAMLLLTRELLRIRREDLTLKRSRHQKTIDGAVLGTHALCIRFFGEHNDDRLLVLNMDADEHLYVAPEPLLAPPDQTTWEVELSSEEPRFGGHGTKPLESHNESWRLPGENWRLPGRSATFLKATPIKS